MSSAKDHIMSATLSIQNLLEHVITLNQNSVILNLICPDPLKMKITSILNKNQFFILDFQSLLNQFLYPDNLYYNINNLFDKSSKPPINTDIQTQNSVPEKLFGNQFFRDKKFIVLLNFPQYILLKIRNKVKINGLYVYKKYIEKNNFNLLKQQPLIKKAILYSKKNIQLLIEELRSETKLVTYYKIIHKIQSLGLDISINCTGVAAQTKNNHILIGTIKNTRKSGIDNDIARLKTITHLITPILMRDNTNSNYLVNITSAKNILIEGGALNNLRGAYRLGRYSGYFLSHFPKSNIQELAPTALKKILTGYGRAEKSLVAKQAKNLMKFPENFEMNDDESDALALLYALNKIK